LPKKSQAGQELFDMFQVPFSRSFKQNWLGEITDKKAILIIVLAGAFLYYMLVIRRRK